MYCTVLNLAKEALERARITGLWFDVHWRWGQDLRAGLWLGFEMFLMSLLRD